MKAIYVVFSDGIERMAYLDQEGGVVNHQKLPFSDPTHPPL